MTETIPDERPQRRREYSGPGSTLGVAALVILLVGLGVWYFEVRGDGGAGGTGAGLGVVNLPAAANPTGKSPAAIEGRAAPDFRLAALDGSTAALTSFRGKFVLLNFWASWCGPCRGETPDLQALQARAGGDHFTVIGVNQQESPGDARAFASEFGVTYPVLLDRAGDVSTAYGVDRGLPVSFLVGPDGVIRKVFLGRVSAQALHDIETGYLQ